MSTDAIQQGIILRTRPLTESSLIVEVLAEEDGRISLVAKGARRPKSPYLGKLDLFHEIRFDYVRSKRSELHNLREMVLVKTYPSFRHDLQRLYSGAYCVNLLEKSTEKDTPIPEVFHLFHSFLPVLHEKGATPKLVFAFELKLLALLGFEPDVEESFLQPGSKKIVGQMIRFGWPETCALQLSSGQEQELGAFIAREISRSLESIPKGRGEALQGK